MNKLLYEKMAITNIRKNRKLYLPYLLTTLGSLVFYYILTSVGSNPNIYNVTTRVEAFEGAATLCGILQSGSFVAAMFAFIFLIYANSFVLKHQKKQLGLYRVLGMERRHIVRIISTEVILIFTVGIVCSLFFGILFDKLMLVLLFKIINQAAPSGFLINLGAIFQTLALTVVIAVLILLRSLISVLHAKDVELLKSENAGEKEPKNRPIITLLGLIALGYGYYIAVQTTNAGSAINRFMPAALAVMVGTYLLFTSGSVTVLKLLKKNKKYYYTTKHFISVSGLLYRMKQNAAGLATICILSTAAIIVLSAGAALYANGERSIHEQMPRMAQLATNPAENANVTALIEDAVTKQGITLENYVSCTYRSSLFSKTENGIAAMDSAVFSNFQDIPDTFILTLEEYNRFNGTTETLADNEILLYASDNFFTGSTLTFQDKTYEIKGVADKTCLKYITDASMALFSKLLIVTPNEEAFSTATSGAPSFYLTWTGFDTKGSNQALEAFVTSLTDSFTANGIEYKVALRHQEREAFYSMYGGILFVGIALGILFSLSTVMIIYYKQISEGYEDRERFLIMQKVGLSKAEIRKSIHSQIMLVFFLPLVTAILHSAVALKIVASCLRMVVIVHMPTFIISVAVTCVLFSLVYAIVYKLTSKEYYNIVNE